MPKLMSFGLIDFKHEDSRTVYVTLINNLLMVPRKKAFYSCLQMFADKYLGGGRRFACVKFERKF